MRRLRDHYHGDHRVAAVAAALAEDRDLTIGACPGSLPVLLIALGTASTAWTRIVICGDPGPIRDDLEELGVAAAVLPEDDAFEELPENEDSGDRSARQRRVAAIEAYASGAVLVANPRSVQRPVPDLAQVSRSSIIIRLGERHDLHQLVDRLVEAGYKVRSVVEGRGELAVRGGIIDVYPWIGADALRIELCGDEVDAIRRFDPFTQESIAKAEEAVLATATGSLATRRIWEQLPAGPVMVLADLPLRGRLEHDHGRREIRFARQLEEGALDGASVGVDRFRGDLQRQFAELRKARSEGDGAIITILARNDEAATDMRGHLTDSSLEAEVLIGRLTGGWRDQELGLVVAHDFELAAREAAKRRVGQRIAGGDPLSSLSDLKRGDLVVHMRHGIGRFQGVTTLEKRGYLEDFLQLEFAEGTKLYVPVDAIDLVQKFIGATGARPELSRIGGTVWAKRRARAEKAIEDLSADLLDAQVKRITAGGIAFPADTADGRRFDTTFPFEETEDQLSTVREIKADMERPVAMDRLLCGDVGFGKTEVAMRAAFKAVAGGRQVAVLAPTTLLAEQHVESFDERFAGTDTSIAGLTRFTAPADRRALLEKVASNQVDILIGTHALLAENLRFADLGLLIVDEEHRFGVKQKEKLRRLRTPDAGQPPDVLALSATPIPRTLHFSLLGIRDISVLAEAPAERLAVETRVAPWDDRLIRTAIHRELERGGQMFFVHNRVQDIDTILHKVARLVPELRLDVVHGQMPEERISRVMDAYRRNEISCLVSTSIIESGIDIPNANTLFVNNAQYFGLGELHQIRGRIGRFRHQAYAYFLVPGNKELTQEARDRLDAIQEYAELGAGFKLAMRDLELRGAGNLLGAEQSGHIDAIGYELYTRLLTQAVERLRREGKAGAETMGECRRETGGSLLLDDAQVGLAVDAYIPDTWLETPALKFEIHKHLDGCQRQSDVMALARSARDRFGVLPPPAVRLFALRALRLRCRELGVKRIDVGDRQLRMHLDGPLPGVLAQANLPELIHVQLDGPVLVLFVKPVLDPDTALVVLGRLLGLELAYLGPSFSVAPVRPPDPPPPQPASGRKSK